MTVTFNMIGIAVADMGRALDFYRLLDLDIPEGSETETHVEVTLPSGIRLGWDTVEMIKTFDVDWTTPAGSPRAGLAFLCDTPAEVDERYDRLIAAGARSHMAPWDAFWGQRYATVYDPDGNGVELFAWQR